MSAFLIYILKVALLTAVFALLYHLLLRRDTFHRMARIVLVSSLFISYILPFCLEGEPRSLSTFSRKRYLGAFSPRLQIQ